MEKINQFLLYHKLDQHNIIQILFLGIVIGILIFMVLRVSATKRFIKDILMEVKDGQLKFSLTRMMMIVGFFSAISAFHLDEVKNGFNYAAWIVLMILAVTGGLPKALSEKINPTQLTPTDTAGKQ